MQVLSAHHCGLAGALPPGLAKALVDLRSVDLSWNRLTGTLPGNWSTRIGAHVFLDHNLISVRG